MKLADRGSTRLSTRNMTYQDWRKAKVEEAQKKIDSGLKGVDRKDRSSEQRRLNSLIKSGGPRLSGKDRRDMGFKRSLGGFGGNKKGTSPTQILADITNEDYQNFEKDFVPVMESVIGEITDPQGPNKAAVEAADQAGLRFDRQRAMFERQMARTGTKINQQQRTKLDQQFGLARGRSLTNAANLARRDKDDENTQALQGQIEAGQSLRGNALQGLGAAAGLESRRQMLGQQLARQQEGSFFSNVGTGAGIGASIGGPVGAVVGGLAGAVVSIFD